MGTKRIWDSFEATFRAKEVASLVDWMRAGVSGSVVGLPGAGKSNLLGFLSHRPDVIAQCLGSTPQAAPLELVIAMVDLNDLPSDDTATFYRVILRSLYEAGDQLGAMDPSLFDAVETLYRKVEKEPDPFLSQSALREALLSFENRGARLVLVLDPFDHFCRTAPKRVLDNLRGLRDAFKATLVYIVGLGCELAYIRDPAELGELYSVLDSRVCWLGPMTRPDARHGIMRIAQATGKSFSQEHIERLIDLTGGYPALLRAASLWLAQAVPAPETAAWGDDLLADSTLQTRLNDIWQALTGEERAALFALQMALEMEQPERAESLRQIETKYESVLAQLQLKRLCAQTDSDWQLFSPLFARFVGGMQGVAAGKIWREPDTNRFFRGETGLTDLSDQDRRLLRHFLDHSQVGYSVDELIDAVWEGSEGVNNWLVQQAIRHLRKQIELNPAQPSYLVTERGVGYRFFPEGAPQW